MTDEQKQAKLANQRKRLWVALVTIVMVLIVLVGLQYIVASQKSAQASRKAQQALEQSEQKLCGIIEIFTTAYSQNPPTTPAGQQLAIEFAKLRKAYGC